MFTYKMRSAQAPRGTRAIMKKSHNVLSVLK